MLVATVDEIGNSLACKALQGRLGSITRFM